ncbi:hypothetical protein [Clostridium beijerinckii]|uniref:hypothetical protein n=1 Tax=Clostridium beijerinckii TaxID=1520 RepID=UPI002430C441|nr:hypothetical protein [Clostridium beijerinckii]MDG5855266.1 hypothetical protein [Clostridium beijerinckii]
MPYEMGGRADKSGNKYEIRWVIYQMLKVIEEEIVSVELESIGKDEESRCITQQCLNIWDLMFEKRIGSARTLSQQILDR